MKTVGVYSFDMLQCQRRSSSDEQKQILPSL